MKTKNESRENFVGVLAAYAAQRAEVVCTVKPTVERPSADHMSIGGCRDAVCRACDSLDLVVYEDSVYDPGVFRGAITCDNLSPVDTFAFRISVDSPPELLFEAEIPCHVSREKLARVALLCSWHNCRYGRSVFNVCPYDGVVSVMVSSHVSALSANPVAETMRFIEEAKAGLEGYMPEFFEVLAGADVYEIIDR